MAEKEATPTRAPPAIGEELLTLQAHLDRPPVQPPPVPLHVLPDQAYLEATLLPLLLRGLEALAAARPPDPLAFLAAYLLSNNPQRDGAALRVEAPAVVEAGSSSTAKDGEQPPQQRSVSQGGGAAAAPPPPPLQHADGTVSLPQELPEKAAAYFFGEAPVGTEGKQPPPPAK